MCRLVVGVFALAACGGGAKRSEPVGNRAAPPPKPICTTERVAAIAKTLQARWNSAEPPVVRCTPGLFPTPGFYLEADDPRGGRRVGVIAHDDRETIPFAHEAERGYTTSITECSTVDLDGDGIDEIVETWRRNANGGSNYWLEIRRLGDRSFSTIRGPHTNVHHPDLGGCSAEVRLAGKTLVITVEHLPGIPPSDCLTAGTHTFTLDGDALVEIDAARLSRR